MQSIGRFTIEKGLGEGGMGVVHVGYDAHLDRRVAIKTLRESSEPAARERLLREARAAAGVSHPNICQVYEVGEEGDALYIVMELLEGASLAARIAEEPLAVPESLQITLGVLAALEAIHARDLIHRDIKPSNVFLTPHGVKLLDFGLAKPVAGDLLDTQLTQPGVAVGTPCYMSPEQWTGEGIGPRSDLFATGALLYEMLTGKPAFPGRNVMEVCEAVLNREPQPLSGGPAVLAADRIIQRALEKRPENRYPDARSMAGDTRTALVQPETTTQGARVRKTTRLIALPLRVLKSDEETDFLAYSLPDAVGNSLAGLESMVIRSSASGERFGPAPDDLARVAREAEVDLVLMGTMLRHGNEIRFTFQLVEAGSNTVLWNETARGTLEDLFSLQDSLAERVVQSLAAPLSSREVRRKVKDVPATAHAYELYLRGNQVRVTTGYQGPLELARDLYRACLDEDPGFAPAWARVARTHRLLAKYELGDVEENRKLAHEAFARAMELNPELPLLHHLYTYQQLEEGRSIEAMVRLLEKALENPSDPNLFAGLVAACRFCGLFEASVAAHRRARRLDPSIRTGVQYTYWLQGDYESAIEEDREDPPFTRAVVLATSGRVAEARETLQELAGRGYEGLERGAINIMLGALEGDRDAVLQGAGDYEGSGFRDAEGFYIMAGALVRVGETKMALAWLERALEWGYFVHRTMVREPWLDPLRTEPEFLSILSRSEEAVRQAAAAYTGAGGERLLGIPPR